MFCGGCVIVAGMIIVSTAHGKNGIHQLIGGRFVLGWGISIMTGEFRMPACDLFHIYQSII